MSQDHVAGSTLGRSPGPEVERPSLDIENQIAHHCNEIVRCTHGAVRSNLLT